MTDSERHSITPLDGLILRRADTKLFLTRVPVPCMVALIMQKGESTDMDMLLLTEQYRDEGKHVLVIDITEDCLDAGEEGQRNKVRDLLSMQQKYEARYRQNTEMPYVLPEEEDDGVEPGKAG